MSAEETQLSDDLDLKGFIRGLNNDLSLLRTGNISISDAHARASLACQMLKGFHLVIQAQKYVDSKMKQTAEIGAG